MSKEKGSIFGSWATLQAESEAGLEREDYKVEQCKSIWAEVNLAYVRDRPVMVANW